MLDWKTRKLMTMYGTQHPTIDVIRLYFQRCEGERFSRASLEKYLNTSSEKILKEVSHSRITENNKYRKSKE